MAFDDPPSLGWALLLDRGVCRVPTTPPPHEARPEPLRWASLDAAVAEVAHALSRAPDAEIMRSTLDGLLERGAAATVGDLLVAAPPPESIDDLLSAAVAFRACIPGHDHETRGLILEALGLQEQLLSVVDALRVQVSSAALAEVLAERAADPLSYLHACPVEVARLLLQSERGMLAGFGAIYAIEHPGKFAAWQEREAARLWRDGERAIARLFASLAPEAVSEGLVPASARLDLDALARCQREEDEFLASLLLAQPHGDFIPVHDAAAGP